MSFLLLCSETEKDGTFPVEGLFDNNNKKNNKRNDKSGGRRQQKSS